MSDKHWIEHAGLKKGALHRQMGIREDKPIPVHRLKEAAKRGGKLGERARLALEMRGMH